MSRTTSRRGRPSYYARSDILPRKSLESLKRDEELA